MFTAESESERILDTDQQLLKLQQKHIGLLFLDHPVFAMDVPKEVQK